MKKKTGKTKQKAKKQLKGITKLRKGILADLKEGEMPIPSIATLLQPENEPYVKPVNDKFFKGETKRDYIKALGVNFLYKVVTRLYSHYIESIDAMAKNEQAQQWLFEQHPDITTILSARLEGLPKAPIDKETMDIARRMLVNLSNVKYDCDEVSNEQANKIIKFAVAKLELSRKKRELLASEEPAVKKRKHRIREFQLETLENWIKKRREDNTTKPPSIENCAMQLFDESLEDQIARGGYPNARSLAYAFRKRCRDLSDTSNLTGDRRGRKRGKRKA